MYADILVEINSLEKTFTYKIPSGINALAGERALVPFGSRKLEGFIMKTYKEGNFDYEVKDIISLIDDHPVINKEMMELGKYISNKNLSSLISAYQTMLPRALKAKIKSNINKKYLIFLKCVSSNNIKTEKQKEIYNYILDKGEVLKSEISSKAIVKTLISNGNIKEYKKEIYRLDDKIKKIKKNYVLTKEQKDVLTKIEFGKFKPYLLHGVTGSGKTLVYIKLIEKVLESGKEAILLVPEISLTPQVVDIFKSHFGEVVAILHSGLSDGEKFDEWRKIERGEVSIAIGARSAIFAPFTKLGIIIIDEEHSTSYKQDNIPRYSALDIALKRGMTYFIPVVLGSATPSVESYTRAKIGVYELLEMKERVNKNLPKVELIDMKDEFKKGNRIFSSLVVSKINERLDNNEQVIILLNRRGFSTVVSCHDCGFTHKCPNCDIPLTYHKKGNIMKCHYCDYSSPKYLECPECRSRNINSFGMGTEKLEEIINSTFDKAKTIRMDVDTTRKKNAHKRIIDDFGSGKYNILVGTQMIAKGLDFPLVTLVVVVSGDASLNIPDFRSAERTYQLLSQVAGRAGRASLPGEVIIQGFNMNHYSIISAKDNNYELFYKEEMKIRKTLKYPPYYNLCLIKVSGKNSDKVFDEASKISVYLKSHIKDIILGPSFSSMPKVNNVYYVQIIIKFKNTKDIINELLFIRDRYKKGTIFVDIDLNPIKI
ncbi:MAG: primosomal protein N' [Bacilli bacterium]|nr:primosomal protein N' [Bacilli bacterium]